MEHFSVYLEKDDLDLLRELARHMRIPPHVLARSLLSRMLEQEQARWTGRESGKEGEA